MRVWSGVAWWRDFRSASERLLWRALVCVCGCMVFRAWLRASERLRTYWCLMKTLTYVVIHAVWRRITTVRCSMHGDVRRHGCYVVVVQRCGIWHNVCQNDHHYKMDEFKTSFHWREWLPSTAVDSWKKTPHCVRLFGWVRQWICRLPGKIPYCTFIPIWVANMPLYDWVFASLLFGFGYSPFLFLGNYSACLRL